MKTIIRMILASILILGLSTTVLGAYKVSCYAPTDVQHIEINTPINATLGAEDAALWFSFSFPENGYTRIEIDAPAGVSHELVLHKGYAGNVITSAETEYENGSFTTAAIGVFTEVYGENEDAYLLAVDAHPWGDRLLSTEFTLTVHFTPAENWENEPNQDWNFTDPTALDQPVYGTLHDGRDYDYFCVDIPERSRVTVTFKHPDLGSSEKYWMLTFASNDIMYQLDPPAYISGDQPETSIDLGVIFSTRLYIQVAHAWGVDWNGPHDPSMYSFTVHAEPTDTFPDVPADAYYAEAVRWAIAEDLTNGTSRYSFSPEDICSRGQVSAFLWRLEGFPDDYYEAPTEFSDVPYNNEFWYPIHWAYAAGITNGTGENCFSPHAPCTRAHAVTFLWRLAGCPTAQGKDCPFADVSREDYFYEAVSWAIEQGITEGTAPECFSPHSPCTRGDFVTFLYRFSRN